MDLTSLFSHDQIAVMGCFLALATCGFIAFVSFHFGPASQSSGGQQESAARSVTSSPAPVRNVTREERRAA